MEIMTIVADGTDEDIELLRRGRKEWLGQVLSGIRSAESRFQILRFRFLSPASFGALSFLEFEFYAEARGKTISNRYSIYFAIFVNY